MNVEYFESENCSQCIDDEHFVALYHCRQMYVVETVLLQSANRQSQYCHDLDFVG